MTAAPVAERPVAERAAAERPAAQEAPGPEAQCRVRGVVVRRVEPVSESFVRLVFGPESAGDPLPFPALGADQWFRLFLPAGGRRDAELLPPWGGAAGWYQRWQGLPPESRAVIRNYTVRAIRGGDGPDWEFDVDFVLHRDAAGALEGTAAGWAAAAAPGDRAAVLGQGTIFTRLCDPCRVLAVCDETGLPGIEAILADLPEGVSADVIAEVPTDDDARALPGAASVTWIARDRGMGWEPALAEAMRDGGTDSLYAVGCNELALGARRMAREAGYDDERITFCSYWRAQRERRAPRRAEAGAA
ncbi:siderophore-interacting protein [Rothia sp. AR01]|uniref:Siderophore-interacting protein n=1 Tax=Rothia santali TaxID=2949643 RepID=A0A9X2HDX6_9MICC|nr:siderophore-interacting protein [Rothia santali]MCP3425922.1 siderophore-interacting protein [Rothia santali]